jgi:hypothetical protein
VRKDENAHEEKTSNIATYFDPHAPIACPIATFGVEAPSQGWGAALSSGTVGAPGPTARLGPLPLARHAPGEIPLSRDTLRMHRANRTLAENARARLLFAPCFARAMLLSSRYTNNERTDGQNAQRAR